MYFILFCNLHFALKLLLLLLPIIPIYLFDPNFIENAAGRESEIIYIALIYSTISILLNSKVGLRIINRKIFSINMTTVTFLLIISNFLGYSLLAIFFLYFIVVDVPLSVKISASEDVGNE